MKMYRLVADGLRPIFAGSKDAASAARREVAVAENRSKSGIAIVEVEVPTDKAGLIDFLNRLHA
jgi:hypothetical protein